jgi:hypothetical protein
MGQAQAKPKTVLVPPLFEPHGLHDRDARAGSAYPVAFGQPARARFFGDLVADGVTVSSVLRPPREHFDVGVSVTKTQRGIVTPELSLFSAAPASSRYDGSFVRASNGKGSLSLSGCAMLAQSGTGAFFNIKSGVSPVIGLRWSGANAGLGVGVDRTGKPSLAWAVGWLKSGLMLGYEFSRVDGCSRERAALAHERALQGARLNATVELRDPRDNARAELSTSFLYHVAVGRQVQNPLEKESVVGITNYIDIGAEMITSLNGNELREFTLGAAWQINTNWMVKACIEQTGMSAAIALKSWWMPTCTLALSQRVDFANPRALPKTGVWFTAENIGREQYSRAVLLHAERGLVREHAATDVEITTAERRGRIEVAAEDESRLQGAVEDARMRADRARF